MVMRVIARQMNIKSVIRGLV